MLYTDILPFPRGDTRDGTDATVGDNPTDALNLEGAEYVVPDIDPNNPTTLRTNQPIRLRCVRNVANISLLPKRVVVYSTTAGVNDREVTGYVTTTAARPAGVVDEFLPTSGAPNNHLFYIVVEGPTLAIVGQTAGATTNIAADNAVVAQTAATSQSATAGHVENQVLTGATQPLADQVQNRIGIAISARTTGETGEDILIEMRKPG